MQMWILKDNRKKVTGDVDSFNSSPNLAGPAGARTR
jgi:hypothetical protein